MSVGTMTSKGQITIPKDVRDALGLAPGTKVTFTRNEAGEYIITASRPSLSALAGRLKADGRPLTLAEMDEAVASGAGELLDRH